VNDLTVVAETLPRLIDRAALALTSARTSAEVLEARDMARVAYDAAKSAGRMAKAKAAHDEVIAAVYRAQADAAVIEARAKVRLADEYDDAQRRGEVATVGNPSIVGDANDRATAADLGLRRDEIHDARKLRDAEAAEPGKIEAAAEALIARGEEPTKAALRREVVGEPEAAPSAPAEADPHAKLRAEFRKMTREAQEDDWIGLRLSDAEQKARIRKQTGEIADLKMRVKELAESSDLGPVVSNLHAQVARLKDARDEKQTLLAKETRRANFFEAEVAKLRAQLENRVEVL
jgi:hypothetical protein